MVFKVHEQDNDTEITNIPTSIDQKVRYFLKSKNFVTCVKFMIAYLS